jgi:NAD(P)-dependent dehydrogenase (short-subunit alcohol dehydrogenase family)
VVLITGGSSGIGLAAARKLAEAGAITIVCGARPEKLARRKRSSRNRATSWSHFRSTWPTWPTLRPHGEVAERTYGGVDVLVNNAGRSIRRGIENSYDRFHDFERCMQLNYFGALRVTMGLLPKMVEKRQGQVINISSIGVLTNAPRFSAYVASKAALDAWTRCAASEFADRA